MVGRQSIKAMLKLDLWSELSVLCDKPLARSVKEAEERDFRA
jgi:predicted dehydrogenase